MSNRKSAAREHRVTLALKWHHLDGCDISEIQQRFIDNGYGEYAYSTISEYLNEAPAEEIRERIEQEHADVRLRIIDRHERKHDRARNAEAAATEREEVVALRPGATVNGGDSPITVQDWEVLDESEHPPGATEHDKRIRFTDETRTIRPGESYYIQDPDGDPIYEEYVAAVREVPDDRQQSFLRREQSHHLEQQGEAAGVYEENVNLSMDGDFSVEINETRVTEENVDEFTSE